MMKIKMLVMSCVAALCACGTPPPINSGTGGGSGGGSAQVTVVEVAADVTVDTTWSKTNTYVLKQLIYVNGATLTIEPGTIVMGDASSALVVSRGAKLVASGTATEPIVFTSSLPVGQRGSPQGDWGGLVFLGRATINTVGGENSAEGLVDDPRNKYGGNDDTYDCGTLRYVRV